MRHCFGFVALVLAAACGGSSPSPQGPAAPPPPPPTPAPAPTLTLDINGVAWGIAAEGGEDHPADEYGRKVITPAFELEVMPWPDAEVFIQTLSEYLAGVREQNEIEVLHQVDGGRGSFEAVVSTGDRIDGSVLIKDPRGGDGAYCSFILEDAAQDWRAPLAACTSLTPSSAPPQH